MNLKLRDMLKFANKLHNFQYHFINSIYEMWWKKNTGSAESSKIMFKKQETKNVLHMISFVYHNIKRIFSHSSIT